MPGERIRGFRHRHYSVIYTYRQVLEHLYETGIGKRTQFNTKVTQKLIDNVTDRLNTLRNSATNNTIERLYNEER